MKLWLVVSVMATVVSWLGMTVSHDAHTAALRRYYMLYGALNGHTPPRGYAVGIWALAFIAATVSPVLCLAVWAIRWALA